MVQPFSRITALVLALTACSEAAPAGNSDQEAEKPPRAEKALDGWGPFEFGMGFDEALTTGAGLRWDNDSFRKCQDEMPLRGCTLKASEESHVPLTAGVALLPRLEFNREGRLYTVNMQKIMRGEIAPEQCEYAHGQLLDHLDQEWGRGKPRAGEKLPIRRSTPKGRPFFRTAGSEGRVFVIEPEEFSSRPDGRKIMILSHYTAKSEYTPADCWLSVFYSGPKSLERPPLEPVAIESASNAVDE